VSTQVDDANPIDAAPANLSRVDGDPYYRDDLAYVHQQGFGFHADICAPGILALLEPVRANGGLVLELGCGSGALTRYLVEAGHRVLATDASPAMLELARAAVPGAGDVRVLRLPEDPLPAADAIVSIGHVLSYLTDEDQVRRSLVAIATALRPGGVLAIDLCDLRWGEARTNAPNQGRVGADWAVITHFERPVPDHFVRDITTFVRVAGADNVWRRDDERHDTVLMDTREVPDLLARHGITARTAPSFGDGTTLPDGLVAVIGQRS
jgi:SAM-dependent methyltransferase